MSETNKRGNRPHGITIRFTTEEYAFIEWFAKRMDTDKSNVPRMLISLYQTEHAELMREYRSDKERQDIEASNAEAMWAQEKAMNAVSEVIEAEELRQASME